MTGKKVNFDRVIGYSPLECVDPQKQHQLVKINKQIIDHYYHSSDNDSILVAGAGSGLEAVWVYTEFSITTIAVDININPQMGKLTERRLRFQKQDLEKLAFKDNTFALIYSYHVLEHVSNHEVVISELYRVLEPGGILFIGFPNKNRVFSYIGTSQKVSVTEKIKWNLKDFKDRLRGRFENRLGAHAGFTEREFYRDASVFFHEVYPVRNQYMGIKYSKMAPLIRLILGLRFAEFLFPSNYFVCIK